MVRLWTDKIRKREIYKNLQESVDFYADFTVVKCRVATFLTAPILLTLRVLYLVVLDGQLCVLKDWRFQLFPMGSIGCHERDS